MFNITVHGFFKVFFIIFNINTLKLLKKFKKINKILKRILSQVKKHNKKTQTLSDNYETEVGLSNLLPVRI
jgi:hypothetical protein